jgi:hypothetical protein
MHAYGHEWSCQLVYNPRMREGAGLSDLEGSERFWSRCRRLIVLERNAGVSTSLSYMSALSINYIIFSEHAESGLLIGKQDLLLMNSERTWVTGYGVN